MTCPVDRPMPAHQVVLACRSRYFKSLLADSLSEDAIPEVLEIEAPDPPVTVARMLAFLYSGTLPPATTDQLLQDLVVADRFGIAQMKTFCENAVQVSVANAARLFELGDLLSAQRMREVRRFGRDSWFWPACVDRF
jgi:BTB/POZ domain